MKRRRLLLVAAFLLVAALAVPAAQAPPLVRFGVVTDIHYADTDPVGTRAYRESIGKLAECVQVMNAKGVAFLVELGDFKDQDKTPDEARTGLTGALIGTFGSAAGGGRPYGLTCAPNGNLLVTREENDEVVEFDNATGALVRVFAGTGLNNPTGLALGPNGNLFVANRDSGNVVEFQGATGVFVRTFASGLPGAPFSIAFGPNGNLFVALGFGGGQAVELDGATGAVVRSFSTSGDPRGLTFGPKGNLFVGSLGTNTVAEFDITTGALIRTLSGGLTHPHGLTFGPNGNLFVADFAPPRVSEFDGASGGVVGPFVTSGSASPIELMFGPSSGPCGPTTVRALVPLQNGTATFSSPVNFQHSPGQAIDGIFDDSTGSWAIAQYDGFGGTNPETAVWETVTDLSADVLTFTLYFNHGNPGAPAWPFSFLGDCR